MSTLALFRVSGRGHGSGGSGGSAAGAVAAAESGAAGGGPPGKTGADRDSTPGGGCPDCELAQPDSTASAIVTKESPNNFAILSRFIGRLIPFCPRARQPA